MLTIIVVLISYFMFGFQLAVDKFLTYWLFVTVMTLAGSALLILCGAISKTVDVGNMVASLVLLLFVLFGTPFHPPIVTHTIHQAASMSTKRTYQFTTAG